MAVVEMATHDGPRSFNPNGIAAQLLRVFRNSDEEALANEQLEVLRRFSVRAWFWDLVEPRTCATCSTPVSHGTTPGASWLMSAARRGFHAVRRDFGRDRACVGNINNARAMRSSTARPKKGKKHHVTLKGDAVRPRRGSIALAARHACAEIPDLGPKPMPRAASDFASAKSLASARSAWPVDGWWRSYGDPQLDGLIHESIAGSPSLSAAVARFHAAQGYAQAQVRHCFRRSMRSPPSITKTRARTSGGPKVPTGWHATGTIGLGFKPRPGPLGQEQGKPFEAAKKDAESGPLRRRRSAACPDHRNCFQPMPISLRFTPSATVWRAHSTSARRPSSLPGSDMTQASLRWTSSSKWRRAFRRPGGPGLDRRGNPSRQARAGRG